MLLLSVPSLSWEDALLRLIVAAVLGGAVGLEREWREREAGFRTHLLVSVGSALFTIVSAYGFREFLTSGDNVIRADPTRIAAQIVTGIGFLGAGAIIRQGLSVRGLTTAATLWLVAAIGLSSGAGYYSVAVFTTLVALISLWPLRIGAHLVITRFRPESGRLLVQLPDRREPRAARHVGRAARRQAAHARDQPGGRPAHRPARRRAAQGGGGDRGDREARRGGARAGGPLDRLTARLCSQNPNKLRELAALLPDWELELLGAEGYPEEGSDSYYENARGKALFGREVGPAEAWMLGEDSGLEVEALGGAPGIRSARYAPGEDANAKLLDELRGVEGDARRARYVCELVLIGPGRPGAPRHGDLRGPHLRGAARDGGVRLRPGVHPGGPDSKRWPSSATTGSPATRIAPEPQQPYDRNQ